MKYQNYEILLQNKSHPSPVCDAITASSQHCDLASYTASAAHAKSYLIEQLHLH